MFATANNAANDMAKQIADLEKSKAAAKSKQEAPAGEEATAKGGKRGSFLGFVSKKNAKNGATLEQDNSNHTGVQTALTEDETLHSLRMNDSPISMASKKKVLEQPSPAVSKKKGKKKSSSSKEKRKMDAPDGAEEKKIVASTRRSSAISVEEGEGSATLKPPLGGGGADGARRQRARRVSPRAGTVPRFLLGDTHSLSGREKEKLSIPQVDGGGEALQPEEAEKEDVVTELPPPAAPLIVEPEEPQLIEEGDLLYYEEEMTKCSSSRATGTKEAPTPPTPRKKSILKGNAAAADIPVRSIAVNPGITQTITITQDFSDDITCLTMDDFEAKTGRAKTRVKRTGRRNTGGGAAMHTDSEHSSKGDPTMGLSDAGLAEILRKDIHSKKEGVLIAGLDAIAEFAAKGSKQRSKVCAFGAIPSILRIMDNKKTTKNVLISAFGALEKLTTKDSKNQETACELGCIPTIAQTMQRNLANAKVLGMASKTLEMLTNFMRLDNADDAEEDMYEDIPTQGALTVLSCCLMTHPKDKEILAHAVGAITNICMYRRDQMQMLSEAGGIAAITAAISKKWKSKTRKTQAQKDLEVIVAAVDVSSDEEEDDDDDNSESSDSEEEYEEGSTSGAST